MSDERPSPASVAPDHGGGADAASGPAPGTPDASDEAAASAPAPPASDGAGARSGEGDRGAGDDRPRRRRWPRRLAIAAAILLVLWTAGGFLGVPALVQHVAVPRIAERLTGELRLDAVSFNPFTLGTVLEGLEVTDAAGDRVLGFARLEANLSLLVSIVRPGWRVERARLVDPSAELVIAEDGTLNLAGLVRPPAEPPPPGERAPAEIPHLVIAELAIDGADLGFRDLAVAPPVETRVTDLDLAIERLDTAPEHDNPHSIEAAIGADGRLAWEGTTLLDPLTARGTVTLENVDLGTFGPYVRSTTGVRLDRGRLDVEVDYALAPARFGERLVVEVRRAAVRELDARAGDRPLLAAESLAVEDVVADLDDSSVTVAAITIDGLDAVVRRGADGRLEVMERLAAAGGRAPAGAAAADAAGDGNAAAAGGGDPAAAGADDATPGTSEADGAADGSTAASPARRDLAAIEARIPRLLAALQYLAEDVAAGWTISIDGVRAGGSSLRIDDDSLDPPLEASVTAIELEAGPMASDTGFRTPLRLTATGPGDAGLEIDGEIDPAGGAVGLRIVVDGLPAERFAGSLPRPLPGPLAGAELTEARIGVDGRLDGELVGDVVDATWDGRIDVTRLATAQADGAGPLGLGSLELEGRLVARGPRGEDGPSGTWEGRVDLAGLEARMDVAGGPGAATLETAGAAGELSFAMPAAGPEASWDGRLTLAGLDLEHASGLPSRVRLDDARLEAARLAWAGGRGTLDAELLELEGPDVGAVLTAARENASETAPPDAGADTSADPDAASDAPPDDEGHAAPLIVRLERLAVRGGAFSLEDRGTDPPLSIAGSNLELTVDRLDTGGDGGPATMDLRTSIGDLGTVAVSGDVDAFRDLPFLDLAVDVAEVGLPPLSPIATPRLGYRIDRGRLGVSAPVRLEDGDLDAPVDVRLSSFHLGERVPGTSTPGVPLKLGLDLLRDGDDVITTGFRLRGDVASPRFDLGDAIFNGFFSAFGNVAGAPFRLLGDLVGAGEDADLSRVRFDPGTAEPAAGESTPLDLLAQALADRPGLRLTIAGVSGPEDVEALREQALDRLVRERRRTLRDTDAGATEEAALRGLLAERRPDAVRALVPVPPGRRDQPRPTVEELRTLLRETIELAETVLADLESRRAERVRTFLVETGGIDASRLHVVPREEVAAERDIEPGPIAAFDLGPGD